MSVRRLPVLAALAATLIPVEVDAQRQVQPPSRAIAECTDCELQAARLATLGTDVDLPFDDEFVVTRLRDGRFVASSLPAGGELHVFAADGSHTGIASRSGRGPGEFTWIQRLIGSPLGLHVFDPPARRRSLLDSALNFIRADPVPGQVLSGAPLDDSLLVVSMWVPTREHGGYRLHILGPDGSIRRSFDEVEDASAGGMTAIEQRSVAVRNRAIHAGHVNQYVIDEWTQLGQLRGRLSREVDWFAPWSDRCCTVDPDRPPEPRIRDLHVDSAGLVWVLVTVADRRWSEGVEPSEFGPTGYAIGDRHRFFDSIVEVIDPVAGTLVGTTRLDEALHAFVGDGLVSSYELDLMASRVLIGIWEVTVPPSGSRR